MIVFGKTIVIRPLSSEDKHDYCLALSDFRVSGTLRGEIPGRDGLTLFSECSQSELYLKFDQTLHRKIDGKLCIFAVALASTGEFIGSVGSYAIDEELMGLSYWLSADYHGSGLGTETLKTYCSPALKHFQKKTIIANVAHDNPASNAAVQKAGFKLSHQAKDAGFGTTDGRDLFEWP